MDTHHPSGLGYGEPNQRCQECAWFQPNQATQNCVGARFDGTRVTVDPDCRACELWEPKIPSCDACGACCPKPSTRFPSAKPMKNGWTNPRNGFVYTPMGGETFVASPPLLGKVPVVQPCWATANRVRPTGAKFTLHDPQTAASWI